MAGTYTAGTQYSATSQVTSANLIALVESMTLANLGTSEINSAAESLIQIFSDTADMSTTAGHAGYHTTKNLPLFTDGTDIHAVRMIPPSATGINGGPAYSAIQNAWVEKWTNAGGAAAAAGDVLISALDSDGARFKFTTAAATQHKNPRVVGVALEAIADGSAGWICRMGICEVNAIITAALPDGNDKSITRGDYLVTSGTTKQARSGGAPRGNMAGTADEILAGVPFGAFAVALDSLAADGALTAYLLPTIGTGALARVPPTQVLTNTTPATVFTEVDVTSSLIEDAHSPVASVMIQVNLEGNRAAAAAEVGTDLSKDGTAVAAAFHTRRDTNGAPGSGITMDESFVLECPTALTAATTTPGNVYQYRLSSGTNLSTPYTQYQHQLIGYWY